MTIRMAPRFVRPLLGRMFRPILQRHYATFVRHVSPVIEQYLSGGTPSEKSPISADTLIGWYLAEARKLPDASEAVKLETMASLILSLNFAALHSTTITCTDVVINILSYESVQELIQILRDEIKHVLEGTNGSWSLASLDKMHRLDSVVRETLRLDGVDGVSLHRLVKGDITGEDGLVLQKGTKIGVSSYSIHRDEVQYPNGMKFDPFRFSRPFDKMSQSEPCYEDSVPGVQDYSHSATEHFLPFGYGSQVSTRTHVRKGSNSLIANDSYTQIPLPCLSTYNMLVSQSTNENSFHTTGMSRSLVCDSHDQDVGGTHPSRLRYKACRGETQDRLDWNCHHTSQKGASHGQKER